MPQRHRDTEANLFRDALSQLLPYPEASRLSKIDRGDTGKFPFAIELACAEIPFETKRRLTITYHGVPLGDFEPDFIVENQVVVEVKSASAHDRVFDAQVLTYLRLTGLRTGLLLNFGRPVLKDGIKRFRL